MEKVKKRKKPDKKPKTCYCGKTFMGAGRAIYCSSRCAGKKRREKPGFLESEKVRKAKWYQKNRSAVQAVQSDYRKNNKEKIKEKNKAYRLRKVGPKKG